MSTSTAEANPTENARTRHRPPVHEQHVDGFGTVRVTPLDPTADLDVIHPWVTHERARFWGMTGCTREQVHEIYAYLDTLTTHHAYILHRDHQPVAIFQTYDPAADRVSECYSVEPGDVGMHLLIAPVGGGAAEPGFTHHLLSVFIRFVFATPTHRRLIAEPDARNEKAITRLTHAGFVLGPEIILPEIDIPDVHLPEKRARLVIFDRDPST